jgi:hypothetical protein
VCLVSWYDASGDTKFRRFDSKGEPLGPVATLPGTIHRPLVAWDGKAFLISNADSRVVAGYISEAGAILTPELLPAGPEKVSGAALATDGAGHALIVTAGAGHDRFTGTFLSNDVVPDDGSGGQGGEPSTTTAGTSGAPIGGSTPTTAGTSGSATDDGEAGESSAGSGGSSAGTTSSPHKTDEGCGCSVAGGDTSHSPWL